MEATRVDLLLLETGNARVEQVWLKLQKRCQWWINWNRDRRWRGVGLWIFFSNRLKNYRSEFRWASSGDVVACTSWPSSYDSHWSYKYKIHLRFICIFMYYAYASFSCDLLEREAFKDSRYMHSHFYCYVVFTAIFQCLFTLIFHNIFKCTSSLALHCKRIYILIIVIQNFK